MNNFFKLRDFFYTRHIHQSMWIDYPDLLWTVGANNGNPSFLNANADIWSDCRSSYFQSVSQYMPINNSGCGDSLVGSVKSRIKATKTTKTGLTRSSRG